METTYGKQPLNEKEGNVLFNNALNTFNLRLYGNNNSTRKKEGRRKEEGRKCFI